MLNNGDKIALTACSNSINKNNANIITTLKEQLEAMGLLVTTSKYLFAESAYISNTAVKRADELNSFFGDSSIKAVFDVSGGDIANTMLEYIDFNIIKDNPKPFFGYSDLTTILNAIYTKSNCPAFLYQIKNLVFNSPLQTERFKNSIMQNMNDLSNIGWSFIQGKKIDGVVVGGNLRCLLKLACTQFFPHLNNRVLFLESLGGGAECIASYLHQLKQMGAFREISGLLLGTFTELEKGMSLDSFSNMIKDIVDNPQLPIAKTQEVGHSNNSKCLVIGREYHIIDR